MNVITIESEAYKDLVTKINAIAKFVVDHQEDDNINPDEVWVDSYEVCTFLKISKRTLQRYRSLGELPFQTIYHKTYYKESDVHTFIRDNANLIASILSRK